MVIITDVNGKEIKYIYIYDTVSVLNVISFEIYINIESPKLSIHNISLSDSGEEIMQVIGYFSNVPCAYSIPVSTQFYVLQSFAYYKV